MADYASVLSAALQLSVDEQLRLIDDLASHLPDDRPPSLSPEWHAELERRCNEIDPHAPEPPALSFLQEAACEGFRRGAYIGKHPSLSVCQLLILPSFENAVSWDVVHVTARRADPHTRLYRSCWRMDIDEQAMRSPVERMKHPRPYTPTVEVDWVLIDGEHVESILARLRTFRVPLAVANPSVGCDGTTFELFVGEFFCNARICWWCDLPEEWRELQPVITDLEHLFSQAWECGAKPAL
ncbi:MAG: addiction module protein [Planctomycetia bacterium]|nr:addiction module protein [Planctomycetia bacterium]